MLHEECVNWIYIIVQCARVNIRQQQKRCNRESSSNDAAIEAWTVVIQQIVASIAHISTLAQPVIIQAPQQLNTNIIKVVKTRKAVNF